MITAMFVTLWGVLKRGLYLLGIDYNSFAKCENVCWFKGISFAVICLLCVPFDNTLHAYQKIIYI